MWSLQRQRRDTGALHGLLESLDSDSSYLIDRVQDLPGPPTTGVAQVESTSQSGLAMRRGQRYPRFSCRQEHLTDGDVIESIGDQSTRELSLAVIR